MDWAQYNSNHTMQKQMVNLQYFSAWNTEKLHRFSNLCRFYRKFSQFNNLIFCVDWQLSSFPAYTPKQVTKFSSHIQHIKLRLVERWYDLLLVIMILVRTIMETLRLECTTQSLLLKENVYTNKQSATFVNIHKLANSFHLTFCCC